jgi:hypothetical protein
MSDYDQFAAAFLKELAPEGPLEELLAGEITRAAWRLQRCAETEADPAFDPTNQTSIDRARAQAHRILHQSTADLRRLQADRPTPPAESEVGLRSIPTPRQQTPHNTVIARNAPCPCNSGEKYKRCCGKTAPPILYPGLSRAA